MSENSLVWNFIAKDKASGTADKVGSKLGNLGKKIAKGFGVAALGGVTALGVGFADLLKDSSKVASDLGESVNAVQKVFGNQSKTILDWGKNNAEAFGLSKRAFNELVTPLGAILQNTGLSLGQTSKWTVDLTKRAADMASVFNTSVPDALNAIQAGLRGEQDPLEKYGVSLSAAKVQAEALTETHKRSAKELTSTELATARLNIIMKQTASSAGDFQQTSNQLANSQRIEQARLENLQASIGQKLLPLQLAWTKAKLAFASVVSQYVLPLINKLADWVGNNLPKAYEKAKTFVMSLSGVFKVLVSTGQNVISFYREHAELINTVAVSIISALAAVKAIRTGIALWTAAQTLLNAALAANPIGLIVIAIAALVGGLIYAYRNSTTFRNIVNAAFTAVKAAFFSLVDAAKPLFDAFVDLGKSAKKLWDSLKPVRDWIVTNLFPVLLYLGGKAVDAVVAGFKAFAWAVQHVIWPAVKLIIGFFVDIISATVRVVSFVVSMIAGIVRVISGGVGLVKTAVGKVINVVKGPWNAAKDWLTGPAKDMIEGLGKGMIQKAKDVGKWVKDIGNKIINGVKNFFGIHSPSTVMAGIGLNLIRGLIVGMASHNPLDIAKKVFGGLPSALASMVNKGFIDIAKLSGKALNALSSLGGSIFGVSSGSVSLKGLPASVLKWANVAAQALQFAGAPLSWLPSLLSRMLRESGGNQFAINNWDITARNGDPSRGLMQVIGSTFSAYAGPFYRSGIYDPLANIYAAIKYTIARYGSGPAGWNRPGGYDDGGWLLPGWTAMFNGTNDREAVFTKSQIADFTRSGGNTYIFQHSGPLIGNNVDDWIVSKLDSLKRTRRIS
jgi:SLT domain-containing protein